MSTVVTEVNADGTRLAKVLTGWRRYAPVLATVTVFLLMFGVGSARYEYFLHGQTILNVLINNAHLIVIAVGMTFVILTGGIDLSVGAVLALSTMITLELVEKAGWSPAIVIPLVLVTGAGLGLGMGAVIHYFKIQPFIVTLAGMFLARGAAYAISTDSLSFKHPFFRTMANERVRLPDRMSFTYSVIIALVVVAIAFYVLHYTRLGRNVYAIGGNEQSALLMGLPVARTKLAVYTISGLCSAVGGVLYMFFISSGWGSHGIGLELDAIAAVVIGGTLLAGGSGYVLGTLVGVMVLGLIQIILQFEGNLSAWWTKIVVGALLFAFILLQRTIAARQR